VLSILDESARIRYTYELDAPLTDKIEAVAKKIYRAGGVSYTAAAKKRRFRSASRKSPSTVWI
jgi:formate--tetrahydrofolate ligase